MSVSIEKLCIEVQFEIIDEWDIDLYHKVSKMINSTFGVIDFSDDLYGFQLEVSYYDYLKYGHDEYLKLIDTLRENIEQLASDYEKSKECMEIL